jgi:hypothetical protein
VEPNLYKQFPYLISGEYLLGIADEIHSPKGSPQHDKLESTGVISLPITKEGEMTVLYTELTNKPTGRTTI